MLQVITRWKCVWITVTNRITFLITSGDIVVESMPNQNFKNESGT